MDMNNSIKSSTIILAVISSFWSSADSFISPSADGDYNYPIIRVDGVFLANIGGNIDQHN